MFLPRDVPHTFIVEGDADAPPDVGRLKEIAPLYGNEIVGRPLS